MYILCVLLLSGCAQRSAPAPVVEIQTFNQSNGVNNNSIKMGEYTVRAGETLYSIAWRADKDIRVIAQLNKLSPPYKIFPGQVLLLAKADSKGGGAVTTHNQSSNSTHHSKTPSKNLHKKPVAQTKKQEYVKTTPEQRTSINKSLKLANNASRSEFSTKIKKWVWPSNGKMIRQFSSRAQGTKGIDFAGKRGANVSAAADGKVVYSGNALRGYGNLIIVKHNDDYLSAYAHNDKLLVKEQQTIKAGQLIATMGDSGADQIMLHFEIRFRGKSVNPAKYLPKK